MALYAVVSWTFICSSQKCLKLDIWANELPPHASLCLYFSLSVILLPHPSSKESRVTFSLPLLCILTAILRTRFDYVSLTG